MLSSCTFPPASSHSAIGSTAAIGQLTDSVERSRRGSYSEDLDHKGRAATKDRSSSASRRQQQGAHHVTPVFDRVRQRFRTGLRSVRGSLAVDLDGYDRRLNSIPYLLDRRNLLGDGERRPLARGQKRDVRGRRSTSCAVTRIQHRGQKASPLSNIGRFSRSTSIQSSMALNFARQHADRADADEGVKPRLAVPASAGRAHHGGFQVPGTRCARSARRRGHVRNAQRRVAGEQNLKR